MAFRRFQSLKVVLLLLAVVVGSSFADSENVSENDPKNSENTEDEEPTFGIIDFIVLVAIGAGGIYYFFIRKKSDDTRVSQYVIQPTTVPSSSGATEKGFIGKMKHSKRRMVVFYGSQTG